MPTVKILDSNNYNIPSLRDVTLSWNVQTQHSTAMNVEAIELACREAARSLGYQTLKDHQLLVVSSLVKGSDVFGVLPTGYGKSLCFTLLPFVFDKLLGTNNSIVIVITPLTAIIKDQVSS